MRTSDGIELFVQRTGRGRPIVFVHEFSGDARSWEPQIRHFGRHYRCVTFNARGYPPSAVPETAEAYSQARAADDLADIVTALGAGPAHIVGLSMGGFAALHLGLRHPELARSLTVAGCGYGAKPEQQPQFGDECRAEADHAEAIGMPAYARELADGAYAQRLRMTSAARWRLFADRLAEHSVRGMALTLRGVLACRPSLWHLEDALRRLRVPTLLLSGDEDEPCLEPNLYLKRVIPDAALCVVPRAGHLVNLEDPALFNDIVTRFVTAVDGGRWHGSTKETRS